MTDDKNTLPTQLMMLDIDEVLTRHGATTEQLLTAAQAIATAAIGDLINRGTDPDALHPLADAIAEQIRTALHQRIAEGPKPDW